MFGTQSLFNIGKKSKRKSKDESSEKSAAVVPNEAPITRTSESLLPNHPKTRRKTLMSKVAPNIDIDSSDVTTNSTVSQAPIATNSNNSATANISSTTTSTTPSHDSSRRPANKTPISVFSDSDSSDDSTSVVTTVFTRERETLDQIMFSPTSLIPLANAIQLKFDMKFSEGFPALIDASLQANSSRYSQKIDDSEQVISEVETMTKESMELCNQLADKTNDIETKADVTLGTMKKTHAKLNSLIDAKLSISIYLILFIFFVFRSIISVLTYVGTFVGGIFKANIATKREERKKKE
ncbi:hypothetical protein TVAG_246030 [Trichomonas vaginalis G3]|uniref:Uncharacterized protein n=1 Tax=Trichomonas vaginalis (strain ATCC PRA-98 / G3) TaxID=412133 RepID=A2E4R1_TRIV3|nr:hypothetical protein TVAGG3_0862640 [Trichomonas vaginalis G3]EAY12371.1 hypothetical protein TVAG_246030 [Trichomonas vaginalis G3]KAI5500789.1 hypothetical protein TVAGG3_0862640 [Trichomonas vaginalis G3]|eukprot:XP_001324594.1 hypothetical protein [Trichomonas vaginalis G3]